jgi:hypothetical protein
MPVKVDELYFDLTARDKNLNRDLARISKKLTDFGEKAAKDLQQILDPSLSPISAFIRNSKGQTTGVRKSGAQLGKEFLDGLEGVFKQRATGTREKLFRGDITRKEFEKQGREAGREFNKAILAQLSILRSKGILDDKTQQSFVSKLKDTGEEAGRGFGQKFSSTTLQSFFKLQRVLRVAFAGGLLSLVTLITRKMTQAFRRLSQFVDKTITEAGDIGRIRRSFDQLASSIQAAPARLLSKAREASAGLVNDLNLIKQLNFALQAGLPATEDQLARLVFVARRLGESVGRDATEAFQRLVNSIVKQERRVLDELGIIVRFQKAHKEWARAMGITGRALTTQETILANLATVSAAAEQAVSRLGAETDDAGKKFIRAKTAAENIRLTFLDIINTSQPLLFFLDEVNEKFEELADNIDENFADIASDVDVFISNLVDGVKEAVREMAFLITTFKRGIDEITFKKEFDFIAGKVGAVEPFAGGTLGAIRRENLQQDITKASELRKRDFQTEQRRNRERIRGFKNEDDLVARIKRKREDIEELQAKGRTKTAQVMQLELDFLKQQALVVENRLRKEAGALETRLRLQFPKIDRLPGETDIQQEERLARTVQLTESLGVANAAIGIFVSQRLDDEEAEQEELDKAIAKARERLRLLEAEIRLIQEFSGGTTFAGIESAALRQTLQDIRAIDAEILSLKESLKAAGVESDLVNARLAELENIRSDLRIKAKRQARETPEQRLKEDAEAAAEALKKLNRESSILPGFGVGFLKDLPAQSREALAELDRVTGGFDALKTGLIAAANAFDERLVQRFRDAIEVSKLQRRELVELLLTFDEIKDVLDAFPELGAAFFAALDPDTLAEVVRILRNVASATANVAAAERALADAQTGEDKDKIRAATEALAIAEAERKRIIAAMRAEINALNVSEETRRALLEALEVLTDKQVEALKTFLKNLRGIRAGVRGIIQLADAFGKLDENVRQALQGIENILSGIEQFSIGFATGNPFQIFGGLVQGIGGLANFISGVFSGGGPSPEQVRMREEADKTADALRALAESAAKLDAALSGLIGRQLTLDFSQIRAIVNREMREQFDPADLDPGERFDPQALDAFQINATRDALREMGITVSDLEDIADATGVDVSALTALLKGETVVLAELNAEIAAVNEALELLAEQAFRSFGTQIDLLRAKFDIFDDVFEKPVDRLQALIDILTDPDLGFLPEEIQKQLKEFNLTTPEGRSALDAFIRTLFTRLAAGDFSVLGGLTPDEFKQALLDTEELLDEIAENTTDDGTGGDTESAIIRKSITEVTGNRMVGVLTTIAIINQGILAITKEILLEMGGTLPTDLQAITFRSPATQLDILEIEQQQLDRLVEIRDILAGGNFAGPEPVPISSDDIPYVPSIQTAPPPAVAPSVTINNPTFNADIHTTGGVSVEDARLLVREESRLLVEEVDVAFAKRIDRQTTRVMR